MEQKIFDSGNLLPSDSVNDNDLQFPIQNERDSGFPINTVTAATEILDKLAGKDTVPTSTPSDTEAPGVGPSPVNPNPLWKPDPNLSPEENLKALQDWMMLYFGQAYDFGIYRSFNNFTGQENLGFNYGYILSYLYEVLSDFPAFNSFSDEATEALAEKIADVSYNFINAQFQSALSYQSWYLQQEYNSPLNQVNRLAAAGLSSVFAIGGYNSGNAQSPAGVPQIQQPQNSGAGQIEAQHRQSQLGFIGSLVSAASSFLPGAAGAVAQLVSSFATKKLTAKQIQLSDSEIINNAATYELLRSQRAEIENNFALQNFDRIFNASEFEVSSAEKNLSAARNKYLDIFNSNKVADLKEEGYRVWVKTKSGQREERDLNINTTKNAIENGGKLTDGSVIEGSESWGAGASFNQKAGASVGLPGLASVKGEAQVGVNGHYDKSNRDAISKTKETSHSSTTDFESTKQGYNSNGTSFTLGDTEFRAITISRKVPLPEHKAYIDQCLREYDKALDDYNTLSTGARARLCSLLDNLIENTSEFSKRLVYSEYMKRINNLFMPKATKAD